MFTCNSLISKPFTFQYFKDKSSTDTKREKSAITVILSPRTKRESQSGFVENQYNTPSVLRKTTNVGFYLEKCYYF